MALTTVPVIAAAAVLWLLGAFSSAALYDSGGFGEASANLNFLFNSLGKSRFVPALPHPYIKWAEEGFGYQGIGGFILLGAGGLRIVFDKAFRHTVWIQRSRVIITGILICICIWLATNPEVIWNEYPLFRWVTPGWIGSLLRIFRSVGRFVWPVCYVLLLFGVISAGYRKGKRRFLGFGLLSMCLVIHLAEFSAFLDGRANETRHLIGYKELDEHRLDQFVDRYSHIYNFDLDKWQDIAMYAGTHRLTLNQSYLSRINWRTVLADTAKQEEKLWRGEASPDTLYLFPASWEMENWPQAIPNFYIYKNSGYYIGSLYPIEALQEYEIHQIGAKEQGAK